MDNLNRVLMLTVAAWLWGFSAATAQNCIDWMSNNEDKLKTFWQDATFKDVKDCVDKVKENNTDIQGYWDFESELLYDDVNVITLKLFSVTDSANIEVLSDNSQRTLGNLDGELIKDQLLLNAALFSKDPRVIEFLLDSDADASLENTYGKTAFDLIESNEYKDSIKSDPVYWRLNDARFE